MWVDLRRLLQCLGRSVDTAEERATMDGVIAGERHLLNVTNATLRQRHNILSRRATERGEEDITEDRHRASSSKYGHRARSVRSPRKTTRGLLLSRSLARSPMKSAEVTVDWGDSRFRIWS